MERHYNNSGNEKRPTQARIEDLLSRYYEAHGDRLAYEIVRSIPIDGHEVAWMKYAAKSMDGDMSKEIVGHTLRCACVFEEVEDDAEVVGLGGEDDCLPRKVALYLRQQELRAEYINRFKDDAMWGEEYALLEHVPEVVMDLIEKDKRGEFIGEGTNGAHFWGGHMYMQTVEAITGKPMRELWVDMAKMKAAKQIDVEGCVIQEYREPPAPSWTECGRYEHSGFTGIAAMPSHSKMKQCWQITILAPNGRVIAEGIEGPQLYHSPDFGVDVDDIATVEEAIKQIIEGYLIDPMSQA